MRPIAEEDFLRVYDEHADGVFRHCCLRLGDRERGKEVMFEAFRRTWTFIAKGNVVDAMKVMLYREANRVIEEGAPTAAPDTAELPEVLRELPAEHRLVFILHYVDGFSSAEIGNIIGGSAVVHGMTLRDIGDRLSQPTHAA